MDLGTWRLLLDDDLPPRVREALTIADRSASAEQARLARTHAANALVDAFALSVREACELMELGWCCGDLRRAA